MSEPEKVNGVEEPEVKASPPPPLPPPPPPPPNPQRKPRLNRRTFHLKDNPIVNLFSNISDQKKPAAASLEKTADKEEKPFQKKIISLKRPQSNKTKGNGSSTIISLKSSSFSIKTRNENTVPTEVSSTSDPPPKKKHKPITWP